MSVDLHRAAIVVSEFLQFLPDAIDLTGPVPPSDAGLSPPTLDGRPSCCASAAPGRRAIASKTSAQRNCLTSLLPSFDHLVGAGDQWRRQLDPERLRSLQIHDQIEFGGLLNRQVARFGPA